MEPKHYLHHIDGLRAIAVISVIAYHFNEYLLPGGYLGVDIFFVISGFVITGYLLRSKASNTSSYFADFYLKRLRRLTPALITCLVISSFAFLLLTTQPSKDIFYTASSAIFGVANIFLWFKSADYFSIDATLNPFTHTWSLGIEEQFYLFFPALLLTLGITKHSRKQHKYTTYILTSIIILSMLSFILLSTFSPNTGWYLIFSRAWELGIGCAGYFLFSKGIRSPGWLTTLCIIGIAIAIFMPIELQIIATFIATFSTLSLILINPKNHCIIRTLTSPPMKWIGLLSYSLYLWHWPVLVLSKYTIGIHGKALIFTFIVFFLLSIASYYFIEKPLRHFKLFKSSTLELLAYSLLIGLTAASLLFLPPKLINRHNNILSEAFDIPPAPKWVVDCHGKANLSKKANPYKECLSATRSAEKPHALYLLGDSHAAQLTFMFESALQGTGYQLRFINDEISFPYNLIRGAKTSKSLDFVINEMQPNDIIAISFHRGRLNKHRDNHIAMPSEIKVNSKSEHILSSLLSYAQIIKNKGGRLLFIRDTPLMAFISTSEACKLQSQLFGSNSCKVTLEQDLHTRTRQDQVFDTIIERFPESCQWDPLKALYTNQRSFDAFSKGQYTMMDWHHITQKTSENLAAKFQNPLNKCIQERH